MEGAERIHQLDGFRVVELRTDNGGEFLSRIFQDYLASHGIHHGLSAPYHSHQLGLVERMNRTVLTQMRILLSQAGFPDSFWPLALSDAAHHVNLRPTLSDPDDIPYRKWYNRMPDLTFVSGFRFGCYVSATLERPNSKLGDHAISGVYLGVSPNRKACRILLFLGKIVEELRVSPQPKRFPFRDNPKLLSGLRFDAGNFARPGGISAADQFDFINSKLDLSSFKSDQTSKSLDVDFQFPEDSVTDSITSWSDPLPNVSVPSDLFSEPTSAPSPVPPGFNSMSASHSSEVIPDESAQLDPAYATQALHYRELVAEHDAFLEPITSAPPLVDLPSDTILSAAMLPSVPNHYLEAVKSQDLHLWREAMHEELQALIEHQTYSLVDLPPGRKAIGCMWLVKVITVTKRVSWLAVTLKLTVSTTTISLLRS